MQVGKQTGLYHLLDVLQENLRGRTDIQVAKQTGMTWGGMNE